MDYSHLIRYSPGLSLRIPATSFGWLVSACMAACLSHALAIEVVLGDLNQVYDGSPKIPSFATTPANLPVDLVYENTSNPPAPVSQVVLNNTPSPLALSYSSQPFQAQGVSAFGDYLQLGGTSRKLQACEVTLVTWADAGSYPTWANANPEGYFHPVTLSLYHVTETKQLLFLTEVERTIFVPWKPLTLPNGDPYTSNGYAFQAIFDFPNGITLPEKVLALVSYNTQSSGFDPIDTAGPYDQLNVAIRTSAFTVGSDAYPTTVLRVEYSADNPKGLWKYVTDGRAPLFRLHALSTQTKNQPVNAGTYSVTASISDSTYKSTVLDSLVVEKAVADVQVQNSWFYTGAPAPAVIITDPLNLSVDVTYDGSPTPPISMGNYTVSAQVNDPNYAGSVSGQFTLKPSFQSWIEQKITSAGLPPDQAGSHQDPDLDGIPNLTEYAFNLNPMAALGSDSGPTPFLPRLALKDGAWIFTYRRNLDAADISFAIENQVDLAQPGPWPTITGPETILSDDGQTQVIEVSLPEPTDPQRFYRLRLHR